MLWKTFLMIVVTFFSWIVLTMVWVAVLGMRLKAKANLPPGGAMATDILGLKAMLFHSPWYSVMVAALVLGAVWLLKYWLHKGVPN